MNEGKNERMKEGRKIPRESRSFQDVKCLCEASRDRLWRAEFDRGKDRQSEKKETSKKTRKEENKREKETQTEARMGSKDVPSLEISMEPWKKA